MLLCIECGGPRRVFVDWEFWIESIVPEAETIDIGRERDVRGGRGRAEELCTNDGVDSREGSKSEGVIGPLAFTSDTASLKELATLAMLLWARALSPGRKDGFGGARSEDGVGWGELSAEMESSTAQLLSLVGPWLAVKSGLLRMRDALLALVERRWEE